MLDQNQRDLVTSAQKYWEMIADGLARGGWSYGYVPFVDSTGRKLFCVDVHRDDGRRFVVHTEDLNVAFAELEAQCHANGGESVSR